MNKSKILQKVLVILMLINFCLEYFGAVIIAATTEENRLESSKYLIAEANGQISRIIPETTVGEFKSYFNVESEEIHVYADETLGKEVTEGYIATGMYMVAHGIEEKYELSVIGDITKNGELDQIDLNLLIKHVVGLKSGQLKGIEAISGDLSGDRNINQVDITILIRYIVYHELYVPEIKRPLAPSIEVTSGSKGEEDWYGSDVEVRISENGTNIERTIYKVSGVATKDETEIHGEENIRLVNEGEYKITAYSYSYDGAKSVVNTKTIKIDKTAPKLSITTEKGLGTIVVKAEATDELSGISDYTYYIGEKDEEGNIVWQEGIRKTGREHTFEGLERNTEYYIKVEVRDKAGNKNSREEKCSTTNVPELVDEKKSEESKDEEGNITWKEGVRSEEPEHDFTGLEKNKEYEIKVEAVDKAGNKTEKQKTQKTEDVPELVDAKKSEESKDEEGNPTKEPNVTVEKSEEDWTKEDVIVKIELDPELDPEGDYEIEYSKDGGETWEPYDPEEGIRVEENGDVEVRLTDGENHGEGITVTIDNIDKTLPELEIEANGKSNSIEVKAKATDEPSGIKDYTYYIGEKDEEGNIVWSEGIKTEEPTHTFENLKQNTEYYVKVEVEDKAGNKTEEQTKVKTSEVPELVDDKKSEESKDEEGNPTKEPNVTVEKSEEDWTNKDVIVKVELDPEVDPEDKYDIEYSKDGGETWEPYDPEEGIKVEENGDVEVRLTDGENSGEGITIPITNIDKKAPEGVINTDTTKASVIVEVEAEDDLSGIKEYIYYIGEEDEEGNIRWSEGIRKEEPEHTFEGLNPSTEYKVKVEVVDKAGNELTLEKDVVTLEDFDASNYIKITQSTKKWTSEDVIVTIKSIPTEYTTEYSEDGKTWTEFKNKQEIRVTENSTVYARVRDGEKVGEVVSLSITNIDKEKPEVEIIPSDITSRSFKVSMNAKDEISGIAKIIWYYKPANNETYEQESYEYVVIGSTAKGKTEITTEYSYTDLISGNYWVCAEVTDAAGNSIVTDTVYVEPLTITAGSDGIEINASKNWTNQDLEVGMRSTDERYRILTSKDKENWTSTSNYTMTENGSIYGKLTDGINSGEIVEYKVTNIDKEKPVVEMEAEEVTSKKFTIDLSFTDNSSGLGKIVWHYRNIINDEYIEVEEDYQTINGETAGELETHKKLTVDNLIKGRYEIYAVVTDVAGNIVNTKEGIEGETTTPIITVDLEEITSGGNAITLEPSTTNWTNKPITITATNTDERYEIQLSEDGTNYETTDTITIEQNKEVYARLTDGVNAGESTSIAISNIDTSAAVGNIQNTETTSKTFKVEANITDNASGLGKIDWYMRKKGEEEYQKTTQEYQTIGGAEAGELETTKEIEYENLTSGTYEVYAVITDVAGNETTTTKIEVTLTTITNGTNGIEITSSNENWTNEDIQMTATTKDERYTVQTSKDGETYTDEGTITYAENGTIYARLTDGINVGEPVEKSFNNIDKEAAKVGVEVERITSRGFTQTIEVEDNASGLSKIEIYYKKAGEEEYQVQEEIYQEEKGKIAGETNTSKNVTVDGLTSGTYEVYVEVTDVAGNKTSTKDTDSKTITLETITAGETAITLTPSTAGWTNKPVTIGATNTDERYQVQISKDGETWEVANEIEVDSNTTVSARLYDGINSGEATSYTVRNIDTTKATGEIQCTDTTTKSMDIKVIAEDAESGIGEITWYYKKVGEETVRSKTENYKTINGTETGEHKKEATLKFDDLTSGTYEVYAVIKDVAGNETTTETISVTLKTVTSAQTAVTLSQNINYWTNTDVKVTATTTDSNFTLQTSRDGENWTEDTEITVTENGTVYARLYDGVNGGETASITIGNIDKEASTIGEITNTPGGTSLKLSINITDSPSGVGKVVWYYKEENAGSYTSVTENYQDINGTEAGEQSKKAETTIEGLEAGATYKVYAEIYDVAGNKVTASEISAMTNQAPEISSVNYVSKTTNSITVRAQATDADGDELKYTIYTSENVNGPYTARGTATGSSGSTVTLTASGLSEYTNYYYYVDVTDKIATDEDSKGKNVRTYCSGSNLYCNGGSRDKVSCSSCGGSGNTSRACGSSGFTMSAGVISGKCPQCGADAVEYVYTCSSCNATYTRSACGNTSAACGWMQNAPSSCTNRITESCSNCGGDGRVWEENPCTHGYTYSHNYCSHGYVSQHD